MPSKPNSIQALAATKIPTGGRLYGWLSLGLGLVLFSLSGVVFQWTVPDGGTSGANLVAGLNIAALLILGWRFWPAALASNLAVAVLAVFESGIRASNSDWQASLAAGAGQALGATVAALLLSRITAYRVLPGSAGQYILWVPALVFTVVLGRATAALLATAPVLPGKDIIPAIARGTLADLLGILGILPVAAALTNPRRLASRFGLGTLLFIIGLVVAIGLLVRKTVPNLSAPLLLLSVLAGLFAPRLVGLRWGLLIQGPVFLALFLTATAVGWKEAPGPLAVVPIPVIALALSLAGLALACTTQGTDESVDSLLLAWEGRHPLQRHVTRPPMADALRAAGISLTIVVLASFWISRIEKQRTLASLRAQAELLRDVAHIEMQAGIQLQERLAQRWGVVPDLTESQWRQEARVAFDLAALEGLDWIEPNGKVRWSESGLSKEVRAGALRTAELLGRAPGLLATTNRTVISPPLDLPEGGKGFLASTVLLKGADLTGHLVMRYQFASLLDVVLRHTARLRLDFRVGIRANGQTLCETEPMPRRALSRWTVSTPWEIPGGSWAIELTPRSARAVGQHWEGSTATLLAGILLSVLVGVLIFFHRVSREESANADEAQRLAGIGSWEYDIANRTEAWSDQLYRLLGHPPGSIPETRESLLAAIKEEDRSRAAEALSAVASGGSPADFKCRIQTQTDGTRHLHCTAQLVRDHLGNPLRVVGTVADVTEDVRVAESLRSARDAAETANRAKGEFLATMSHELRTPMNGILGMTELLQQTPLSPTQQELTATVSASGKNLLSIINDILDFAMLETGNLTPSQEPFGLRNLIDEVITEVTRNKSPKPIDVVSIVSPDLPETVLGDPARLRQVLTHLVSNAFKFTHSGNVTVRVQRNPGIIGKTSIRFAVRDTGIGIPEDKLPLLFRPFQQLDSSDARKYSGTGLGLAISQRMLHRMGGHIHVESHPGTGSIFWFDLVLAPAAPGSPSPTPAKSPAPQLTVGVVSTEELVLEAFRAMAPHVGFHLETDPARLLSSGDGSDNASKCALVLDERSLGTPGVDAFLQQPTRKIRIVWLPAPDRPPDLPLPSGVRPDAILPRPLTSAALALALEKAFEPPPDPPAKSAPAAMVETPPSPASDLAGMRVLLVESHPISRRLTLLSLAKLGCQSEALDGVEGLAASVGRELPDVALLDRDTLGENLSKAIAVLRPTVGAPGHRPPSVILIFSADEAKESEASDTKGLDGRLAKPFSLSDLKTVLVECSNRKADRLGTA